MPATVGHRPDPGRDKLIERLADELASAKLTIGILTERLDWYRASVADRDTALGIVQGKPPAKRAARHGLSLVK